MKLLLTAPSPWPIGPGAALPRVAVSAMVPTVPRDRQNQPLEADLPAGGRLEIVSSTQSTSAHGWPIVVIEGRALDAGGVAREDRLGVLYDTLQWSAMATFACPSGALAQHREAAEVVLRSGRIDTTGDVVALADLFS